MNICLPRPDQLLEHPELAALSSLVVHLELARRALMAAYPHIWIGKCRPETQRERRANGLQLRADPLCHDIEDYIRIVLAHHELDHSDIPF